MYYKGFKQYWGQCTGGPVSYLYTAQTSLGGCGLWLRGRGTAAFMWEEVFLISTFFQSIR